MKKSAKSSIEVRGTMVNIISQNDTDYICLTDIARFRNPDATDDLIRNWLRNRNTIEFLGIWEQLHNPGFNPVEFDGIKMRAGLNSFTTLANINDIAITQIRTLLSSNTIQRLNNHNARSLS